jgi:hypothetical protein
VAYEDLVLGNGLRDCCEAEWDVVVVVWHSCGAEWRMGRGKRTGVLVAMGMVTWDRMEVGW